MAFMATRAEAFFARLRDAEDRLAALKQLVTDKTAETEFFEFKGGRIDESTTKKYWSQALSGFANSEGGVLIFGIKTERIVPPEGGRGLDTATDVDLVPKPLQLIQLLKDIHLSATSDVVSGVDYFPVSDPSESGAGFVVCYVPEGKNKPYKAELDTSRNYFQRVSDNFVFLSHSLIRSLFYPKSLARFKLEIKIQQKGTAGLLNQTPIEVTYQNEGNATARDVMMVLSFNKPTVSPDYHSIDYRRIEPHGMGVVESFRTIIHPPLHPGDKTRAFYTLIDISKIAKYVDLKLWVIVYAADMEPTKFQHHFNFGQFEYTDNYDLIPVELFS